MAQLEDVSTAALREALQDADDATTTKRIMVAIAYKQGVSQTELADWYGLSRKTIYNWLQRFEEESIRNAASDKPRSGRPPKLGGGRTGRTPSVATELPQSGRLRRRGVEHPARPASRGGAVRRRVFAHQCVSNPVLCE
ncbi:MULTISPECIES: helix-turn-helix domain-containing protein [unclassified Haladaptatus]|uniref:helix-turn-helix domain-containing protein n=1 Tax=unclassified Haladaptatus TaxID=2622732 RepID=UPI00209C615D|nr:MULTISPECIES: helix-turn-helix domain-containing protein [unclassified Haladaptatus]MCO8243645.1 helix-turn-helix domain-containing protein [Haladaptatus sp. AB643]MCO8255054.1 helix-turn-helix domain-containing protein [Haladaptatus sp. AB618]